jgi:hypothetical protein
MLVTNDVKYQRKFKKKAGCLKTEAQIVISKRCEAASSNQRTLISIADRRRGKTCLLNKRESASVHRTHSSEANSRLDTQEMSRFLWDVHNSPPPVPIWSLTTPSAPPRPTPVRCSLTFTYHLHLYFLLKFLNKIMRTYSFPCVVEISLKKHVLMYVQT